MQDRYLLFRTLVTRVRHDMSHTKSPLLVRYRSSGKVVLVLVLVVNLFNMLRILNISSFSHKDY